MPSQPDDQQLIQEALDEVPGALDRLCRRWLPDVIGWGMRLGGPKVDAEDIAHDVFIVVFRRLNSLQASEAFPSWLYGITRKVVASHRRKAWVRRWLPGVSVPERADDGLVGDPHRSAERSQVAHEVWRALDLLRPHHREVLVLCDLEERPDSEVAAMLDVPKGTVKSRLRRARKELRGHVAALEQAEPATDPQGEPT